MNIQGSKCIEIADIIHGTCIYQIILYIEPCITVCHAKADFFLIANGFQKKVHTLM